MRNRMLIGLLMIIGLLLSASVHAQTQSRDYVVSRPVHSFLNDGQTIRIQVTVSNQGADASSDSRIRLRDGATNTTLQEQTIQPLDNGESRTFTFQLPVSDFPPGSRQVFRIEAGIDDFELAGAPIANNNSTTISIPIPGTPQVTTPQPFRTPAPGQTTQPPPTTDTDDEPMFRVNPDGSFTIMGETFTRNEILIGMAIFIGVVLLLWLLSLVYRLLFRQPPAMEPWQPPYGTVPQLDPNSLGGRRQAWQAHAQNGLILAASVEGAFHPVKLLLSMDGQKLKNWRFKAMRLAQYDNYGRVARTNSLAPRRAINRLNRILKRRHRMSDEKLRKAIRPAARDIVKVLKRRIRKNTAFLPVAFDIRFEGKTGDVRILFELWSYQTGQWQRVDQWEPEMSVYAKKLQENYTYTIHGQSGGETDKEFAQRLEDDVVWLLMETVVLPSAQHEDSRAPSNTYDTPDTLTGMQPITDSHTPV